MANYDSRILIRFWAKVDKTSSPNGCWLWTAATYPDGYGTFFVKGSNFCAHRLSWELLFGSIPEGLCVCHRCDNPPCVNPEHLFLGTREENNHDRHRKGRTNASRGEDNKWAKLTKDGALFIKRSHERGVDLAKKFGVSSTTISKVRSGKVWARVLECSPKESRTR